MSPATDLFRRPPTTGAVRIDPLVGTRPTWREGEAPIYDALVAELGDPFAAVEPALEPEPVEDDALGALTAAADDELLRLVRSIDPVGGAS